MRKSEENGSGVQTINLLIAGLAKQITEAEAEEKDAQVHHEMLMQGAAERRPKPTQRLPLEGHEDDKAEPVRDLGATNEYIHDLHLNCDWLVSTAMSAGKPEQTR